MFKFLTLLAFPIFLFANFNFNDNYEKQITILRKFDVDSSFLQNKYLRDVIADYNTKKKRSLFFQAMNNAVHFLPAIKKALSDSHIPNEFVYLAMAESRLVSKALSNKQAAGIWQFMPTTAKMYGLQVNNYIDERLDMIKSTNIAIRFLGDMYKRFGKWYLAAIAYNCGEGTLMRAIAKAKTDNLAILIDPEKKYIPLESRIYIRKILALALMEGTDEIFDSKYSYIFNIGSNSSVINIELGGGIRLIDIAKDINMTLEDLESLNPHILLGITPLTQESIYNIYIPYSKLRLFKASKKRDSFYSGSLEYIVQSGDSLFQIGLKNKCNYQIIKKLNGLKSNALKIGQKLEIPILYNDKQNPIKRIKNISVLTNIKQKKRYLVKKGDTLYSIARDLQIDIYRLMKQNNLKSSNIYIGESLIVK